MVKRERHCNEVFSRVQLLQATGYESRAAYDQRATKAHFDLFPQLEIVEICEVDDTIVIRDEDITSLFVEEKTCPIISKGRGLDDKTDINHGTVLRVNIKRLGFRRAKQWKSSFREKWVSPCLMPRTHCG